MQIMETQTECGRKFSYFSLLRYLIFLCAPPIASGFAEGSCESPQYLELGTTGVINCFFPDNYLVISWFDSSAYWDHPLIELRDSGKDGRGYLSGEYDLLPNGSLVIRNVSLEHEHTFSAVRIDNPDDKDIPHYIDVVTIVTPQQRYPYISNCSESSPGIYYAQYHGGEVFKCYVNDARPAVQLTWVVRTGSGEKNTTHDHVIKQEQHGAVFSSHAVLTDPFIHSSCITLAVCRVSSQPIFLNDNAAFLFLQNMEDDLPFSIVVPKYVVQGSTAILNCPKLTGQSLLVWNAKTTKAQIQDMIAFAIFGTENFTSTPVIESYVLDDNGSLVISDVTTMHRGTYSCITSNDEREESQIYDVQVYAPAHPEVEGCAPNRYCVLKAAEYDSLTCTIRGVLGDVRLEFRALSADTPGITFMDESTHTIHKAGDFYDVSFSTRYQTTYSTSGMVIIECGVAGNKTELFSDTAVLSLYIDAATDIPPVVIPEENCPSIVLVIMITLAVIASVGIILVALTLWIYARRTRPKDSRRVEYSPGERCSMEPTNINEKDKSEEDKSCKTLLIVPSVARNPSSASSTSNDSGVQVRGYSRSGDLTRLYPNH